MLLKDNIRFLCVVFNKFFWNHCFRISHYNRCKTKYDTEMATPQDVVSTLGCRLGIDLLCPAYIIRLVVSYKNAPTP